MKPEEIELIQELQNALREANTEICVLCKKVNSQHTDCRCCPEKDNRDALIQEAIASTTAPYSSQNQIIKFEEYGSLCITPCPIFKNVKVGSGTCAQNCLRNIKTDYENSYVICKGN